MSIQLNMRRVFTSTDDALNQCSYGVIELADGSLLFGMSRYVDESPFPQVAHWYRSTDDGLTWTQVSTPEGHSGGSGAFPANMTGAIALAPTQNTNGSDAGILRSTNNGASWSKVKDWPIAATPNGRALYTGGIATYGRGSAIAYGILDGDYTNPPSYTARSTDNGATWSNNTAWQYNSPDDYCTIVAAAGNGRLYACHTEWSGINRTSYLDRSDDNGDNWTVMGALPLPGSGILWTPCDIVCFTRDAFVLVGGGGTTPTTSIPWIAWSNDAGATMNLLSASDVTDWPSGDFYSFIYTAKRVTRDCAIMGIEQQNGTPGNPWRLSNDQGRTWPIAATLDVGSWPTYSIAQGASVVTRKGTYLCSQWESEDYESGAVAVYRGALSC